MSRAGMPWAAMGVYNRERSRVKTVTIAIPSLHRPDLIARSLEFLERQSLPAEEWEVVIIENEARPNSVHHDPLPPNTKRIQLSSNEGTTGSINRAVAATESRYLLLLNNDIELQPAYVEKLVRALDSDLKLGFATGKLLRATQRTHLDGAGDAMLRAGAAYRLGHLDRDDGQYDRRMPILSGCGAAVLYRREVFELCGRLDEDFFAYLEDLDLALRANLLGYTGIYLPDAIAYHIGSATLGNAWHPRIVEYLTRNQIYLIVKNYPRLVFFRLLPRIVIYQCLWLILVLGRGGLMACLRGWVGALVGLGGMRRKHRQLMAKRRITDDEFLQRLLESERQIFDWQQSRAQTDRSRLLGAYFALFGKP
jgi:GT2 family glycosyltransferase